MEKTYVVITNAVRGRERHGFAPGLPEVSRSNYNYRKGALGLLHPRIVDYFRKQDDAAIKRRGLVADIMETERGIFAAGAGSEEKKALEEKLAGLQEEDSKILKKMRASVSYSPATNGDVFYSPKPGETAVLIWGLTNRDRYTFNYDNEQYLVLKLMEGEFTPVEGTSLAAVKKGYKNIMGSLDDSVEDQYRHLKAADILVAHKIAELVIEAASRKFSDEEIEQAKARIYKRRGDERGLSARARDFVINV